MLIPDLFYFHFVLLFQYFSLHLHSRHFLLHLLLQSLDFNIQLCYLFFIQYLLLRFFIFHRCELTFGRLQRTRGLLQGLFQGLVIGWEQEQLAWFLSQFLVDHCSLSFDAGVHVNLQIAFEDVETAFLLLDRQMVLQQWLHILIYKFIHQTYYGIVKLKLLGCYIIEGRIFILKLWRYVSWIAARAQPLTTDLNKVSSSALFILPFLLVSLFLMSYSIYSFLA